MKFFSKELSQKLSEIGCVSESTFYYIHTSCMTSEWEGIEQYWEYPNGIDYSTIDKAFTIADFLSDEPYALGNCKLLIWNSLSPFEVCSEVNHELIISKILYFRKELAVCKDQEAFIAESVGL